MHYLQFLSYELGNFTLRMKRYDKSIKYLTFGSHCQSLVP